MTHLSADHAEQVVWFLAKFLCHLLIFWPIAWFVRP
jgi:hypothetical protein